ncbi:hypothetical protein QE417_002769 [Mucilaginibacter terrae]|uniref:Uncharacterized protein n=1 Tax=Mucilaginibacter terrae TaxID=1955052 RepID=A0ABU3GV98_9SPHI|nr:hypothetical protein [Mucilaginibacter terrae]
MIKINITTNNSCNTYHFQVENIIYNVLIHSNHQNNKWQSNSLHITLNLNYQ